jgi:four helix bundle protein
MTEQLLSYEKLDVYQCAIQFLAISAKIIDNLPRGHSTLLDQLKRASLSIVLNIAEASGKTTRADNARFFAIARGSAMECGAVLDACRILGLTNNKLIEDGKPLIVRIVLMLSKMCR